MVPSRLSTKFALAGLLLLAGCGSLQRPDLPQTLPASFRGASDGGAPAAPDFSPDLQGWWKAFSDPTLDALVEQAMAQNLTLAQAISRLRQARLLSGRDGNQFKPTVNAAIQTVQDAAAVDSYFHAGIDASWELGFYGAHDAVRRGADARVGLAAAGVQAARVATVAEVVRRYLELQNARHDEAVLLQMLALDERVLALQAVRQRTHTGSMDERHAVGLRQRQTLGLLAAPRQAAAQAEQALAVLVGQPVPDPAWRTATATALPALQPLVLQQVPTDLLRYRPDIRAAEAEVDKATGELGLARAELYPRVVLGLSFLFAYNITQNRRNVNDNVPSFGPAIDIPLFDWGRRRAAADAREEALNATLLAYRQVVIQACGETETALSALAQAGDRERHLEAVLGLAKRSLELQATRLRLGLGSDVERLEAERVVLQAGGDLVDARAARAQAFVAVYRSLGGAPLDTAAEGAGTVVGTAGLVP